MRQFGLKLWSTNKNYIEEAQKLYKSGMFQYIELYAVPDSYDDTIKLWSKLNIPYVIHAPHFLGGLNLAKKENKGMNFKLAEETIRFADKLRAGIIIFHPGVDGDINETVSQLNEIKDNRVIIENKPYFTIDRVLICNGNSPEDIKFITDNTGLGFCLDAGHAVYSANTRKIAAMDYLKEFVKLKPRIYHFSDGDYNGIYDRHDHFGKGSFPLKRILNILPADCKITIESAKGSEHNLDDFAEDAEFLRNLERTEES